MRFGMRLRKLHLSTIQSAVVLFISILGLFDATLLTVQHYQDFHLPCYVTKGCEIVLTSKYAEIFGVPIAIFGVIYYLYFVTIAYHSFKEPILNYLLIIPASLAAVASLALVYIQGFVIHAWCQYCILSSIITFALLIVCIFINQRKEITHVN